jgi:hypothetical protein
MRRYLGLMFLSVAMAVFPVGISGCAARVRVYDAQHRDSHSWNHSEGVYYQRWEVESHGIRDFRLTDLGRANVRYVNRTIPGAVTFVPTNAFANSSPVNRSMVHMPQREMASARVLDTAPPIVSGKESVLAHPSGFLGLTSRTTPPTAVQNRPVVVRRKIPPPRMPFSAQEKLLTQHPGRPPTPAALNDLRSRTSCAIPQVRKSVPEGSAQGMHPARPNISPAHPQRPEIPPSQPQHTRTMPVPQQNAPKAQRMRPPQNLGRSQPFPPPTAQPKQTIPPNPMLQPPPRNKDNKDGNQQRYHRQWGILLSSKRPGSAAVSAALS